MLFRSGKTAGNDEDLIPVQECRLLAQPVDVDALGCAAGLLKCELGFDITIGSRCSQDKDSWHRHDLVIHSGKVIREADRQLAAPRRIGEMAENA